jgi:hypothetical protein
VHASPDTWESSPSLAFASDGTAWLAWTSATQQTSDIYLSHWLGSHWSDPQALPKAPALEADEPALAVEPDGALWLAWVGFDGVDDEIFVTRWDGRAWSPAWQVSADDDENALYDRQPRLAAGPDGALWLVWTGHQDGVDDEIYYSRWNGTNWTPEAVLSADDKALDVWPTLTLDARGDPWVAWKAQVDDGSGSRLRILVSHWDAERAAWTPEEVVSSPLVEDVDETLPALALSHDGRLHLAWLVSGPEGDGLAYTWQFGSHWLHLAVRQPLAGAPPGPRRRRDPRPAPGPRRPRYRASPVARSIVLRRRAPHPGDGREDRAAPLRLAGRSEAGRNNPGRSHPQPFPGLW